MITLTEKEDGLVFEVKVVPRSSKSEIIGEQNGALKVKLSSPPVDGAANGELVKLFAKRFGISKGSVEIVSGRTARNKRVKIVGVSRYEFFRITGLYDQ
ncbi:MAG: YggU family protein [Acidobacteria bacterium]|nr:YggU family protein [Acidobacteriota bacterium]